MNQQAYEDDVRTRNDAIAEAAMRFLNERGYMIATDGAFWFPMEIGISRDNDRATGFKYRSRKDAYLKALELAAKP